MALAYTEHYTVRDYALWEGDWELIYGAPYPMVPSPSISHQYANGEIYFQLKKAIANCSICNVLFEVDWQSSDDTVVRPDVLVACDFTGEKLTKTPELIVEIVSPTSAKRDELTKFELYQQEGVKFYILAYPDEKIAKVYRLHEGRFIKEADYSNERFDFTIRECDLTIDFSQVWRD